MRQNPLLFFNVSIRFMSPKGVLNQQNNSRSISLDKSEPFYSPFFVYRNFPYSFTPPIGMIIVTRIKVRFVSCALIT